MLILGRGRLHTEGAGQYGLPEGSVGELGHARGEAGLRAEAQVRGGGCGRGHDVPDVPEPELPGYDRLDAAAERVRQRSGHLAARVRLTARDVVAPQASGRGTAGRARAGDRLVGGVEGEQVGPGHVTDVDEIA